jgi:L-threonylcarbamoyladenylate synthase
VIRAADALAIAEAGRLIRAGGLVALPTETVYGLGADALNAEACARIFEAKRRPLFDPLICHIADIAMLERFAVSPSGAALRLCERFWPGPLTVILPKKENLPGIVTSGLDTVAVRLPDHPVALEVIRAAGTPVAAPSANPFGYLSPTTARHVDDALGDAVDLVLDGGPCRVGVESTIVRLDGGRLWILRPGGIAAEELAEATGLSPEQATAATPDAPGMLECHYAPHSRLRIVDEASVHTAEPDAALLSFRGARIPLGMPCCVLSSAGNLREAAARLFSALHELDRPGIRTILAERVPDEGLGRAIMNRLGKAAASGSLNNI